MVQIDLSKVVKEPLELKFSEGDTFVIPTEPNLEMTYQMADFEGKMNDAKTSRDKLDLFVEATLLILKQDKSKKIDDKFVKENLSLKQMEQVFQIYQNQIMENHDNPN
ncbi:hypothetical protein [Paraliobacillus sp. X-1268]|uniref:hypothetical protein n=1 Tax=Paraliobacillus sp. X-1268 TaxID=2213193 RepID=UPI000E3CF77D|nr:hypothetical protein [Paraliobacillus sp. X-1268]